MLGIDDTSVTEGDAGETNAGFTVTLSPASGSTVTVDYAAVPGTATSVDFVAVSGPLSFAPGETAKPVTVPVIGDTLDEPNETFSVNLANPTGALLGRRLGLGKIDLQSPLAVTELVVDGQQARLC